MGNNILVTGGSGFIGANFINKIASNRIFDNIINLDKLSYAANPQNLHIPSTQPYKFVKGDIQDVELVQSLFSEYDISKVVNFAAETHVDRSIEDPEIFFQTNVLGTLSLLRGAFSHWMAGPLEKKTLGRNCLFLQISTDEVFGSISSGSFSEGKPYAPSSPYSASKAGADHLIASYKKTFGLSVGVCIPTNNFGPFQNTEKLIPKIIESALRGDVIPIYGDGENVREWLFVEDFCECILRILQSPKPLDHYLIGSGARFSNIEVAKKICHSLNHLKPKKNNGNYFDQIEFVLDRPGHDYRYALDSSKTYEALNWRPATSFDKGLEKTIRFYIDLNQKDF